MSSFAQVFRAIPFRRCVIALIVTLLLLPVKMQAAQADASASFVARSGNQLTLAGNRFRFGGTNTYTLLFNDTFGDPTGGYGSHAKIDDWFQTAADMGVKVVRLFGFASNGYANSVEPAENTFNDAAFEVRDYALKVAASYGMHVVFPFFDRYGVTELGGVRVIANWLNIDWTTTWTNGAAISDEEALVNHILNHTNQYTNIAYRDDPTFLAWELGNELGGPPASWEETLASYLKSIDGTDAYGNHHLVMGGNEGIDSTFHFDASYLSTIPDVDIVSSHFYPGDNPCTQANEAAAGGKAYIDGEWDWWGVSDSTFSGILTGIENCDAVSGDLFWQITPHASNYGFQEPICATCDGFNMLYPVGESRNGVNTPQNILDRMQGLRTHIFAMNGVSIPPPHITPPTPVQIVVSGTTIAWHGSAGAKNYTIQRTTDLTNGSWETICDRCVNDMQTPWTDSTQPTGTVWYRVQAVNVDGTGTSAFSDPVSN